MAIHLLPGPDNRRYYVYAMICRQEGEQGYIKFGYSSRIGQRLTALKHSCPVPAKVFAIIEAGKRKPHARLLEKALLRHFAARRSTGEWYRFDITQAEDKREFNEGCHAVFRAILGPQHEWWTTISVKALDMHARQQQSMQWERLRLRRAALKAKQKRETQQRSAWKELDAYRMGRPSSLFHP